MFGTESIADNRIRNIADDFISFLFDNGMMLEKAGGYWKNQLYWYVKYKGKYVCYILVNGSGDEEKFFPLTVWTDDCNSYWCSNQQLKGKIKETAIKHIDFCEKCGSCSGGTVKNIFGEKYDNVCQTAFRFINPDLEELQCLKALVLLRKNDINMG